MFSQRPMQLVRTDCVATVTKHRTDRQKNRRKIFTETVWRSKNFKCMLLNTRPLPLKRLTVINIATPNVLGNTMTEKNEILIEIDQKIYLNLINEFFH